MSSFNKAAQILLLLTAFCLLAGAVTAADMNSSANGTDTSKLMNKMIAPSMANAIEAQYSQKFIKSWDQGDLEEVVQDIWDQLQKKGMIKRSADYEIVLGEMESWLYNFKLCYKSSEIGKVHLGMFIPKTIKWDELVREYFLANGMKSVKIGPWWDSFTAQVHNTIPKTKHADTVLGYQAAAIAAD